MTKISFRVMYEYTPGTMSEPFENPDGSLIRYDLGGGLGAHPFSSGFLTLEATKDTVARAIKWATQYDPNAQVWVEKVTETITVERVRQPVDPELFARTAPQWNCVDYPNEGMHSTSPQGNCVWCGMTRSEIAAENARERPSDGSVN